MNITITTINTDWHLCNLHDCILIITKLVNYTIMVEIRKGYTVLASSPNLLLEKIIDQDTWLYCVA